MEPSTKAEELACLNLLEMAGHEERQSKLMDVGDPEFHGKHPHALRSN